MQRFILFLMVAMTAALLDGTQEAVAGSKQRILVISSYHKEYLWSQDTNKGVCAGLVDFGFIDDKLQVAAYSQDDYVETSKALIKKMWMDTKRKNTHQQMADATGRIVAEVAKFKPDLILLGDDNATNYIGNHYIDSGIPIVFWGVNGIPLKYGLLDSVETPGHNVTGIYQAGYLKEGVTFLKQLLPDIKTLAILSDQSPTGRSKVKGLHQLVRQGELPLKIVGTVVTNDLAEWKSRALELANSADAFFVLNHNTIKDETGQSVPQLKLGAWYLKNIKKPDIGHEKQFVEEGILGAVDDSGFKQGYEAVRIVDRILNAGVNPATISSYAPGRGKFIINMERAKMLGIESVVKDSPLVEETIAKSKALEEYP